MQRMAKAAPAKWRPPNTIRTKVIAIAENGGRMLVCEVLDDDGAVLGWCPIGGGVEFGETTVEALNREIREELGCELRIEGPPLVCENIYEHHGEKGHEIVFAFPVRFSDPVIYTRQRFQIREHTGHLHWVEWIDLARFRSGKATLFPKVIADQLTA
jgi:ADP-ribose pyrophosphatase YjhB (NUDIX family)